MHAYQREFIEFALRRGALRFGQFTLKSGRLSPYFFNTGTFDSGAALSDLGRYYANAIVASGLEFDLLDYLREVGGHDNELAAMAAYRAEYGV